MKKKEKMKLRRKKKERNQKRKNEQNGKIERSLSKGMLNLRRKKIKKPMV